MVKDKSQMIASLLVSSVDPEVRSLDTHTPYKHIHNIYILINISLINWNSKFVAFIKELDYLLLVESSTVLGQN